MEDTQQERKLASKEKAASLKAFRVKRKREIDAELSDLIVFENEHMQKLQATQARMDRKAAEDAVTMSSYSQLKYPRQSP